MEAESNLGGLLGKASRLLANHFNNDLSQYNLTIQQWSLLAILWTKDKQKQKELQSSLLKDKATINSLVFYLVKNEFITKNQDTIDKRSFIIALTKKGKDMQNLTIPIAVKNITLATNNIEKTELETTINTLKKIILNLTKDK